ncbi:transposase [Vibrio crassostreae]|uniref:transposase n=1 Tax=Vibrio crassostreae TaxID=246167 RepID=UPI003D0E4627
MEQIVDDTVYEFIGEIRKFKNSQAISPTLGSALNQHSSGGKQNRLSISKLVDFLPQPQRMGLPLILGDNYLRTILIHGARAVIRLSSGKEIVQ